MPLIPLTKELVMTMLVVVKEMVAIVMTNGSNIPTGSSWRPRV